MSKQLIGKRLRAIRDERGFSQDTLADLLGFKDRQTVSAIETGVRRLTADELLVALRELDVTLDYFTDPFQLVGEGCFSWRQTGVSAKQLREYERNAGRWIAAFRALAAQVGRSAPLMRQSLSLTRQSGFEDAMLAGERFVTEFGLGDVPATGLAKVMERELGILVLMVDASKGISGAACRLPELDTILIARREVEGRRHFDLAHELFHILTWNAMPPEHSEESQEIGGNRVEQLANSFAAAVLMPVALLEQRGDWNSLGEEELVARLNTAADELHVTSSALRWRLVALGKVRRSLARSLPETSLRNNGRGIAKGAMPALFSRPFVEVLGLAIEGGHVSLRRAAGMLDLSLDDLVDLFATHGIASPGEL